MVRSLVPLTQKRGRDSCIGPALAGPVSCRRLGPSPGPWASAPLSFSGVVAQTVNGTSRSFLTLITNLNLESRDRSSLTSSSGTSLFQVACLSYPFSVHHRPHLEHPARDTRQSDTGRTVSALMHKSTTHDARTDGLEPAHCCAAAPAVAQSSAPLGAPKPTAHPGANSDVNGQHRCDRPGRALTRYEQHINGTGILDGLGRTSSTPEQPVAWHLVTSSSIEGPHRRDRRPTLTRRRGRHGNVRPLRFLCLPDQGDRNIRSAVHAKRLCFEGVSCVCNASTTAAIGLWGSRRHLRRWPASGRGIHVGSGP